MLFGLLTKKELLVLNVEYLNGCVIFFGQNIQSPVQQDTYPNAQEIFVITIDSVQKYQIDLRELLLS